jgi:hypothetical protein
MGAYADHGETVLGVLKGDLNNRVPVLRVSKGDAIDDSPDDLLLFGDFARH